MKSKKSLGIMHIVASAFFFALMSAFSRAAGDVPTMQKAFFRNIFAFAFAFIMLAMTEEKFKIKKGNVPLLLIRSTFGCLAIICNFYAVDHMAISDANMLNKLSPFFTIIFSYLILKEKADRVEWIAVIIAFIGMLFVAKPSFNLACFPALVGIFGGITAGVAYTMVRVLGVRGERGKLIICFFSGFSTLALLPNLILNYQPMTLREWILLVLTGLAAMGGQINITAAYTYAPAREISVFDYSQIIFAAALGFFFLGQIPDIYSVIGYIIIIGAAFFRWWYQNRK